LKKVAHTLLLISLFLTINNCSTDFSLNAEDGETTIVYGLLDQSETTHYVRVTKSFSASGNAILLATEPDSSLYNNGDDVFEPWEKELEVIVEEVVNGRINNSYSLKDTTVPKEQGAFGSQNGQLVYYFEEPNLNENATYRLTVDIDEGDKIVSAETEVVKDFNFTSKTKNRFIVGTSFASNNINSKYPDIDIEWTETDNGFKYEPSVRFNYTEYYSSGDSAQFFIDWIQETKKIGEASNKKFVIEISGEAFYQFIGNKVTPLPANVTKRVMRGLDFFVTVAGEELNTYIDLSEPSTGIVQEKPKYTNIENGLGLFSSRFKISFIGSLLNTASRQELANGNFTNNLGFCSDMMVDNLDPSLYCN